MYMYTHNIFIFWRDFAQHGIHCSTAHRLTPPPAPPFPLPHPSPTRHALFSAAGWTQKGAGGESGALWYRFFFWRRAVFFLCQREWCAMMGGGVCFFVGESGALGWKVGFFVAFLVGESGALWYRLCKVSIKIKLFFVVQSSYNVTNSVYMYRKYSQCTYFWAMVTFCFCMSLIVCTRIVSTLSALTFEKKYDIEGVCKDAK